MPDAQASVLIVAGVYAAVFLVALLLRSRRGSLERRLQRMSSQVALPVPDHLEDELLRHIARRGRAWLMGNAAAFLTVIVLLFAFRIEVTASLGIVIVIIGFTGGAAASVCVALIDRRRGSFGATSVGRLGGPTVYDLVPSRPAVATGVFAVMALAISGAIVANLGAIGGSVDGPSVAAIMLAIGSVLGLVSWWFASRAIARSRPITGDATTLAWSDALRAESIRDLLVLPFVSAFMSLQLGVPALASVRAPDDPEFTQIATAVSTYGSLAIIVAMGLFWFDRRSARHFKRRLWPSPEESRVA